MFSFIAISVKGDIFCYNAAPTPTTDTSVIHVRYNILVVDISVLGLAINFSLLLLCNISEVRTE